MNIESLYLSILNNFNNYIEMLYTQAMSKLLSEDVKDSNKLINEELIENYLKRRGYVANYILGKRIMIKDFTCVYVHNKYIEIWHDIPNKYTSVFITQSYLTNLPITLNYMERV